MEEAIITLFLDLPWGKLPFPWLSSNSPSCDSRSIALRPQHRQSPLTRYGSIFSLNGCHQSLSGKVLRLRPTICLQGHP